jgi:hypothetical protein
MKNTFNLHYNIKHTGKDCMCTIGSMKSDSRFQINNGNCLANDKKLVCASKTWGSPWKKEYNSNI